ncbi:MAG: hypothetical protein ABSD20_16745 [Terriglobales bacterium]|jgi:hypothetical protein
MNRDNGRPKSAIWLLADSPPLKHADKLDDPLDWRFPTRHNIWTPIETIVNRELFRLQKARIDDRRFYVRNAVKSANDWEQENKSTLAMDIAEFRGLVEEYSPFLILTFGQRVFEFARRSQGDKAKPSFKFWSVEKLCGEFNSRLSRVREGEVILLPLLHAVIAQKFEKCHIAFGGKCNERNYYEHVGCELAAFLHGQFENERLSDLWM